MTVLKLATPATLPPDTAAKVREVADGIDSGRVTDVVVIYATKEEYCYLWASPDATNVLLTTMAQAAALERMKARYATR